MDNFALLHASALLGKHCSSPSPSHTFPCPCLSCASTPLTIAPSFFLCLVLLLALPGALGVDVPCRRRVSRCASCRLLAVGDVEELQALFLRVWCAVRVVVVAQVRRALNQVLGSLGKSGRTR